MTDHHLDQVPRERASCDHTDGPFRRGDAIAFDDAAEIRREPTQYLNDGEALPQLRMTAEYLAPWQIARRRKRVPHRVNTTAPCRSQQRLQNRRKDVRVL